MSDLVFKINFPLLDHRFRYAGIGFILIGLLAGYLYFFGGKPEFFTSKVFAFLTSYLETRTFVIAQTNLLDEIAAITIITGLLFIGFSAEKKENHILKLLRIRALFIAVYISVAFWTVFFLLIFGWPVFLFATSVFPLFLLLFFIAFRIMILTHDKSQKTKISLP